MQVAQLVEHLSHLLLMILPFFKNLIDIFFKKYLNLPKVPSSHNSEFLQVKFYKN